MKMRPVFDFFFPTIEEKITTDGTSWEVAFFDERIGRQNHPMSSQTMGYETELKKENGKFFLVTKINSAVPVFLTSVALVFGLASVLVGGYFALGSFVMLLVFTLVIRGSSRVKHCHHSSKLSEEVNEARTAR